MKLDAVKFGLAAGIIYGAMFFFYAFLGALFGVGGDMLKLIGDFYPGVSPTYPGAIVGAAWGFAIGFFLLHDPGVDLQPPSGGGLAARWRGC